MADCFLVHIDLAKLREHFAESGAELTPDQVLGWLKHSGFRRQTKGEFLCEEITLDLLDPSEIVSNRRL